MRKTYKVTKINGKSKDVHRIIMEKHLGRKLSFNEVIHHKDGNPKNNKLENLELMSRSAHGKIHAKKTPMTKRVCPKCKDTFEIPLRLFRYKKKIKQKKIFCSKGCSISFYRRGKYDKHKMRIIKRGLKDGKTKYRIGKENNIPLSTVYKYTKLR